MMAKNDIPQALRLAESLKIHGKEADAQELETLYPLSKSADFDKKLAWAETAAESESSKSIF